MSYESINDEIESATAEDCVTQYIALEKVKRILGTNHILLTPQFDNLLNKDEGYSVYNLIKFSEKLGQTDDGKVEWDQTDPDNILYFEWCKNEDTGFYTIFSEIVTHTELTDILNDYHQEVSNLYEESTVTMNIPLLLRMLEYSREDAKTDEDLHKATENMISLGKGTQMLTMKDYLKIIQEENEKKKDDVPFEPQAQKSTPWKNPKSKANQLARAMMRKYVEKNKGKTQK